MIRLLPAITISLLILLILGGVFLWWPKYQEFSELRLELEKKEKEVKQKEEYFAELKALSERLKKYPKELAKIDSALSAEATVPNLFNFIQKASSESGLILEELTLGRVTPLASPAGAKKISFSASVSGSYSAFKNFLSMLYQTAKLIELKSIRFSSSGDNEKKDFFTFDLGLETHFYQKPEVKKEEPKLPMGVPGMAE